MANSEMVERVARAMMEYTNKILDPHVRPLTWEECLNEPRIGMIGSAKAAIEAMREPTREMVNAAWIDYEDNKNGVLVAEFSVVHAKTDDELSFDTAYEVWVAMVGAALKEP